MPDPVPKITSTDRDATIRSRWKAAGKFFRDGETGETVFVKAVTWGPFPPDQKPDPDSELRRVRDELGANALRVYEVPEREFLDRCAAIGLRVFIGFPWPHHVDFIADHRLFRDEKERFRRTVAEHRGHPAIAGWFVANEIPAPLARWMGPRNVNRALEAFLDAGREADPEALFSYANYPSTEYLCPRGQDFVSFNIYLENREDYVRYLRRLQHQAGDLPLLVAEFGLDSRAHGEEKQAETLAWHVKETALAGAAGTTLFAWSDRWYRGGETIEGWDFGLTRRDGSAKPVLARVAETWREWHGPADALKALDFPRPRMSIVVCSYRGARLLEPCLASFQKLAYPDFEVLVVNDGDDAEVAAVTAKFPEAHHVALMPHGGLSAARNLGARESTGEVIVYTDDDCEADPDWLTWLAYAFSKWDLAAAGGPNIPPPPDDRVKTMVAAAPGGPAHVLLNDVEAEHLPGCNLAVRREAFDAIGGFDEQFWTAGDDVDFCWRLIAADLRIGFHPAAMVWHHRRFTIKAYLKQQLGYGRAEAMLMPLYP
ncbi:MAG: glycosyltransferase, partial [Verrucomicrobiae bacterium]|nr:glycosyltransferase [Verrucomicrobiae bacterium]